MSISISEFKAWATENRGTAVAVNGGALESASNQIGIFDHVFRRGTVDRNILLLKRERSDSHDAYKLAARLAVLSQLIGKVPCWNCKSGKDRTARFFLGGGRGNMV